MIEIFILLNIVEFTLAFQGDITLKELGEKEYAVLKGNGASS